METQLIKGDCLQEMGAIANGSIDMILCDLPYGTTHNKWDSVIDFEKLWGQYNRIIKPNGAIVLFSQFPFSATLAMSNQKMFRYEWIWEKTIATGFLNANRMPLKKHENILIFYKKLPTYNPQFTEGKPYKSKSGEKTSSNYNDYEPIPIDNNGYRYPVDILFFNTDRGLHPTQKPVALCEYMIRTYTNEGETVLDNCMGSGTTGVACVNTNRNFIGMELDQHYFDIAKARIEKQKQTEKN